MLQFSTHVELVNEALLFLKKTFLVKIIYTMLVHSHLITAKSNENNELADPYHVAIIMAPDIQMLGGSPKHARLHARYTTQSRTVRYNNGLN